MKFYSEMLDKMFDSVTALEIAEKLERDKKAKAEEEMKKAKAEKDLAVRKIETLKKDVDKNYQAYLKSKKALTEATRAFCDKYDDAEDYLLDETSKKLYDLLVKMFQ